MQKKKQQQQIFEYIQYIESNPYKKTEFTKKDRKKNVKKISIYYYR